MFVMLFVGDWSVCRRCFGQVCVLMVICVDNYDYDHDVFASVGAVDINAKKHVPSLQRMNTYNMCD